MTAGFGGIPGGTFARLIRSSTFRVVLVYLGLFSVSIVIVLWFLYWSTAGFMSRQTDEAIKAEIRGLSEQYTQFGTIGLVRALNRRTARARATRGLYLLADSAHRPLAGNLSSWPREKADAEGWLTFQLEYADARGAVNFGRARTFDLSGGLHLLVGRDIRERLEIAQRLRGSVGWGLALALALSVAGGFLISRPLLRRIDAINVTSTEIMAGELERRIPVRGTGDEFDRLAGNLNAMLDRIARLVEGVREVSDNIAHDLRGPLARLRGRLDLALNGSADEASYREAIEHTISEADALLKTFNSLLSIARLEAGAEETRMETFALDTLLGDVIDLYAPLAEAKSISLECSVSDTLTVKGDRHLLFQCLANLLDNAIKFSPEGGAITASADLPVDGVVVEIAVADGGPGISETLKSRVTERFYRIEASRNLPGSGLGLSLAAAIAIHHDGELLLEDNHPGLRAVLRLKRSVDGR